jgi:RimJ/RimL family protein N-acetyltransferase
VRLEAWPDDGLELLRRQNTPQMTAHLGGPETEEALLKRHKRYLNGDGTGQMFVVVAMPGGEAAGSSGYWERTWQGETTYETGYGILAEFWGRGLAVAALLEVVKVAAAKRNHPYLHAFPAVDHAASNAVCRKAGFELAAECEFEYPKGHFARSNDWRTAL